METVKIKQEGLPIEITDTHAFREIKFTIGGIQYNHLFLAESGAIEANPATHRIAEWVYLREQELKEQTSLLKEENERLVKAGDKMKNDLLDALDLKSGVGPTALSMLHNDNQKLKEENEKLREALDQAMIVIRHLQTDGEWELWKRVNAKGYLVDHHKPVLAAYEKLESLLTQSSKKEEVNK